MNQEAVEMTQQLGKVTFYSRTQNKLWTKGETSGNYLLVKSISSDCDNDTLLIKAEPTGPVCHTGSDTCFDEGNQADLPFLDYLEKLIHNRKNDAPDNSYTAELFTKGMPKIAQKVGEEAVEVVIDAVQKNDARLKEETADLLYHLLVLLAERDIKLADVIDVLKARHGS